MKAPTIEEFFGLPKGSFKAFLEKEKEKLRKEEEDRKERVRKSLAERKKNE